MPSTRTHHNLKAPLVFVVVLAVLVTVLYFSPPLVQVRESTSSHPHPDTESDLDRVLVTPRMTSEDLFRFRKDSRYVILPPTDAEQATAMLTECESLWSELQQFKTDPEFMEKRFGPGSRFVQWRERAESFHRHRPSKEIVGSDIHRLAGSLIAVANDYAGSPLSRVPSSTQEEWFRNYYLPMAREAVGDAP